MEKNDEWDEAGEGERPGVGWGGLKPSDRKEMVTNEEIKSERKRRD